MGSIQIAVGSRIEYLEIAGVNCMVVEGVDGNRYASRLHFEPLQDIKDDPLDIPVRMSQLCAALVITANKCNNAATKKTLSLLREELILQCQ